MYSIGVCIYQMLYQSEIINFKPRFNNNDENKLSND